MEKEIINAVPHNDFQAPHVSKGTLAVLPLPVPSLTVEALMSGAKYVLEHCMALLAITPRIFRQRIRVN